MRRIVLLIGMIVVLTVLVVAGEDAQEQLKIYDIIQCDNGVLVAGEIEGEVWLYKYGQEGSLLLRKIIHNQPVNSLKIRVSPLRQAVSIEMQYKATDHVKKTSMFANLFMELDINSFALLRKVPVKKIIQSKIAPKEISTLSFSDFITYRDENNQRTLLLLETKRLPIGKVKLKLYSFEIGEKTKLKLFKTILQDSGFIQRKSPEMEVSLGQLKIYFSSKMGTKIFNISLESFDVDKIDIPKMSRSYKYQFSKNHKKVLFYGEKMELFDLTGDEPRKVYQIDSDDKVVYFDTFLSNDSDFAIILRRDCGCGDKLKPGEVEQRVSVINLATGESYGLDYPALDKKSYHLISKDHYPLKSFDKESGVLTIYNHKIGTAPSDNQASVSSDVEVTGTEKVMEIVLADYPEYKNLQNYNFIITDKAVFGYAGIGQRSKVLVIERADVSEEVELGFFIDG